MNLPDDTGESVANLISNLGHFCEARGLDFIMLVQRGVSCWRAEMDADDFAREFTAKLTLMPKSGADKKAICKALKKLP